MKINSRPVDFAAPSAAMEKTQWTPQSRAAFGRAETLLLVAVGFDFVDSMLGSWPMSEKGRRSKNGKFMEQSDQAHFLDTGVALFSPSPDDVDWSDLRQRISDAVDAWIDRQSWARNASGGRARSSRRGVHWRLGLDFVAPGFASRTSQTLEIANILSTRKEAKGSGRLQGRKRAPKEKKEKRSAILFRTRELDGKRPHRGDKDASEHAPRKLWAAAQIRQQESMEKTALRISLKLMLEFEGVSCAQLVAPPSLKTRSQWRSDYNPATEEFEGTEKGIEAYRQFLLAHWRAEEISDAVREATRELDRSDEDAEAGRGLAAAPGAQKSARRI